MLFKLSTIALIVETTLAASSYIVQLKSDQSFSQFSSQSVSNDLNIKPNDNDTIEIGSFKAFVTSLEDNILDVLKGDASILDIFPNEKVSAFDGPNDSKRDLFKRSRIVLEETVPSKFTKRAGETTQSNAPRHLARLSSREGIFNESAPFEYKYKESGKDVTAYVLDTGITISNSDFEGRATHGKSFVTLGGNNDLNGHGTHVAGILGSKTYGVAKEVSIVNVRVLDSFGDGTVEGIIRGIEWANNDRKSKNLKGVANLSLGGSQINAIDAAVNAAYEDGLVIVTAAGNENSDASDVSPGGAKNAITVGALDDRSDTIAIYSNWGPKVDIFASGVLVKSLSNRGSGTVEKYGTSQASPVVAGLAAVLLEQGVSQTSIKDEIIKLSTKNAISKATYDGNSDYDNTVNRVAYNGIEDSPDRVSNPSTLKPDEELRKFLP